MVLSALHGEGNWEPFAIADTLERFKQIIALLKDICEDRESPVDFEKNPFSRKEKEEILLKIKKLNSKAAFWYWKNFLKDE